MAPWNSRLRKRAPDRPRALQINGDPHFIRRDAENAEKHTLCYVTNEIMGRYRVIDQENINYAAD